MEIILEGQHETRVKVIRREDDFAAVYVEVGEEKFVGMNGYERIWAGFFRFLDVYEKTPTDFREPILIFAHMEPHGTVCATKHEDGVRVEFYNDRGDIFARIQLDDTDIEQWKSQFQEHPPRNRSFKLPSLDPQSRKIDLG